MIIEKLKRLEQDLGGVLGVLAHPLADTSKLIRYNDAESFPAASTIKVYILLGLLQSVQQGDCSLEETITLQTTDQVTGSGVLKSLSPGHTYTLHDIATLMIIVSDNTATNLLIERLGVDTINATCQAHGWQDTNLVGKLQVNKNPSKFSQTSPRDLGDFFHRLWQGELLNAELSHTAKRIFLQQQYTDQLGRDLDFDTYSTESGESSLRIASKSGSIRGVRNDAGVISQGQRSYVISIMTKDCPDQRFHVNNTGSLTIARVSKLVFDTLIKGE